MNEYQITYLTKIVHPDKDMVFAIQKSSFTADDSGRHNGKPKTLDGGRFLDELEVRVAFKGVWKHSLAVLSGG
ncbi:hypothetical protein Tco_1381857 [Tanacetum coccineum]